MGRTLRMIQRILQWVRQKFGGVKSKETQEKATQPPHEAQILPRRWYRLKAQGQGQAKESSWHCECELHHLAHESLNTPCASQEKSKDK